MHRSRRPRRPPRRPSRHVPSVVGSSRRRHDVQSHALTQNYPRMHGCRRLLPESGVDLALCRLLASVGNGRRYVSCGLSADQDRRLAAFRLPRSTSPTGCQPPWSPEGRLRVPPGWVSGPPFPRPRGSRPQPVMGNGQETGTRHWPIAAHQGRFCMRQADPAPAPAITAATTDVRSSDRLVAIAMTALHALAHHVRTVTGIAA